MPPISPICYFPTRVILVDDNEDSLNQLKRGLSKTISTYEIYNNPIKALDQINKQSIYTKEIPFLGQLDAAYEGLPLSCY